MPNQWEAKEIDDDEVLRLLHAGDPPAQKRALEVLYWRWASPMKFFFKKHGCLTKDCEDLMQEAMIKIWNGAASFKGTGQASSWIWTIIRNTLNDHHRKNARRTLESPLDPDNPSHDLANPAAYDQEHDDCIENGIEQFASQFPDRAHALELWSSGMDLQRVAGQLGRSYGATRQFLLECRKKMRPFLEPCLELTANE